MTFLPLEVLVESIQKTLNIIDMDLLHHYSLAIMTTVIDMMIDMMTDMMTDLIAEEVVAGAEEIGEWMNGTNITMIDIVEDGIADQFRHVKEAQAKKRTIIKVAIAQRRMTPVHPAAITVEGADDEAVRVHLRDVGLAHIRAVQEDATGGIIMEIGDATAHRALYHMKLVQGLESFQGVAVGAVIIITIMATSQGRNLEKREK